MTYFFKPFQKFSLWHGCETMSSEPDDNVDDESQESRYEGYEAGVLVTDAIDDSEIDVL